MTYSIKRTLLSTAILASAFGAHANTETGQVGIVSDFKVQVYGVAAISIVNYNVTDNNDASNGFVVENESRIGFRASKEMVDNLNITMQIESGYVDGWQGGKLGARDTYLGASGSWGNLRVGRVLTPLYEIVDWPFSNPGLGSVFDWGGISAHYDRQSNQIRYDSPDYDGFTYALSVGRDGFESGSASRDSMFVSANAKYSFEKITLMAAVETGSEFRGIPGQDNLTYLIGAETSLPGGFSLAAAYKQEELDGYQGVAGNEITQGSYSMVGQYWDGPLGIKLGYAANLDSKLNGSKQADSDSNTVSLQVMGVINGFVPFVRVAGRTVGAADTDIVTRFGLEYGF